MILSTSATHIVNDMLQGELAAMETYQQALAQAGSEPVAEDLKQIHAEHREAANRLRQYVRELGAEPSKGSQTWGAFAKAVEGVAKLFGNAAAIKALQAGENRGVANYEEALTNDNLPANFVEYLRTTLLSQTRSHIQVLDRLLASEPRPENTAND
jgi:uncharacterized protein (TIGR02284 family)